MSATLEDITEQALRLSRAEKFALANRLLSDEDQGTDSIEIEAIWEEELLARIEALDNGTAVGVPYDEVVRAARKRRGE